MPNYDLPELVQSDVDKICGLPFEEDRFDNMPYDLVDFPHFKTHLIELLASDGFGLYEPKTNKEKQYDSSIGFGSFDLQRHTASVDEHTDDVKAGCYFGLFVLKRNVEFWKGRQWYDCRSELRFVSPTGTKDRHRLNLYDLVLFNPRRNHELIFYGDHVTLALFDVRKLKAK